MLTVVVNQNDIKVGKRKSAGYCPVAYALKRVFMGRNDIVVYQDYAFIGQYLVELPPHVGKFIDDFDKKLLVRGISFDLPKPPSDLEFRNDS